ncbi:membrane protein, partial [Pseudomonas monteilii]
EHWCNAGAHRAAIAWLQVGTHLRLRAGHPHLSLFVRHQHRPGRVTRQEVPISLRWFSPRPPLKAWSPVSTSFRAA